MPSSIFAYAFLKAAYGEGVRNPIDAIIPLVKRALMRFGSRDIDQLKIQQTVKGSIGLEIPLNIIRYTFPNLASQGIIRLENHIYKLVNANYVDPYIVELEQNSRAQYERIKAKVNRFFIDYDVTNISPDEFIEQWLDDSSLSFLGGDNPAFSANKRDREINRLMYLIINRNDPDGQFLTDLAGVALGDGLYRAIKAITEYDSPEEVATALSAKMNSVDAYFDTRWVMRALGFGVEQMTHAALELLNLCKSTGCNVLVFLHNVEEIQRVIRTVADRMSYGGDIEGDVASFAAEHGFGPGDLIEFASTIEDKIQALGFKVAEPPSLSVDLSIDERGLDDQLKMDLRQAADQARIADVASLAGIFRLRNGAPKSYLEKCDAIFITTNKGLADASVRYFKALFRERQQLNRVQLCMTDVVFSTRLWTKLPTSLDRLPRDQILAHIMGYLRPSQRLQDDFIRHLRDFVTEGTLTEEVATQIKLSRFVDQALAVEFDYEKTNLTRLEFVSVARNVIEKQKALQTRIRESIKSKARAEAQQELDAALEGFSNIERQIADKDSSLETLRAEIEENAAQIRMMDETAERVNSKISVLVKWGIRFVGAVCFLWMFDTAFSATELIEAALKRAGYSGDTYGIVVARRLLNAFAAVAMTVLTLGGFSLIGAQQRVESMLNRRIMDFIFK